MSYKKKLIEVALPLEAINIACATEKSVPRRGHPQGLHLWWARRPLSACRAVILSSLLDDPSSFPEKFPTEKSQKKERNRLFDIVARYSDWKKENDKELDREISDELSKQGLKLPVAVDPFSGGGSIPFEASKLGLEVIASDLNPVSVFINKCLLEFSRQLKMDSPVFFDDSNLLLNDLGYESSPLLSKEVMAVGSLILNRVKDAVAKNYSLIDGLPVIANFWARTVQCSNPSCRSDVPLVKSLKFIKGKGGKPAQGFKLVVNKKEKSISTEVISFKDKDVTTGTVSRTGAKCPFCGTNIPLEFIRNQTVNGKQLGQFLLGSLLKKDRQRILVAHNQQQEKIALKVKKPEDISTPLPDQALGFRVQRYGMATHGDLFTARQLNTLVAFSTEIQKWINDHGSTKKSCDTLEYRRVVGAYLACALSRLASYNNTICYWNVNGGSVGQIFARQTVAMMWDFIEVNPIEDFSGNWDSALTWVSDVLDSLRFPAKAEVVQTDARSLQYPFNSLIVTDPPYYDQIGYADLSDFFYVFLRRTLRPYFPDLFKTILTPKDSELIATPFRFNGSEEKAKAFFEEGLEQTFKNMVPAVGEYPLTVFYAFKQSESEKADDESSEEVVSSTGWETILNALIRAGFQVISTFPMRTERPSGVKSNVNALASSIILVCRPRSSEATVISRREFVQELKTELPSAIQNLQQSGIAAVDLQQSAIGPGISVFSRYKQVLEADDSKMSVRAALVLINQVLDEVLAQQDSNFDSLTRWAISWFEQFGFESGPFGDANTLSQAKNVSIDGLSSEGIVGAKSGKVSLTRRDKLNDEWVPKPNGGTPHWLAMQHLIRRLEDGGEVEAGFLLKALGSTGESCKDLAYRCFSICEKKGWAQEGFAFNNLVTSWGEIQKQAQLSGGTQGKFKV